MSDALVPHFEARLRCLESKAFDPIARSPCLLTRGTLLAYAALSSSEKARWRSIVASNAAGIWRDEWVDPMSESDRAWYSRFVQACFGYHAEPVGAPLARANELKKVARLCFDQLLGATPKKSKNPGVWLYDGVLDGIEVSVELQYPSNGTQLSYSVRTASMVPFVRVSAEQLYGMGGGMWHGIRATDVDQVFALLARFVRIIGDEQKAVSRLKGGLA
jgi:hypothetical protein